MPALAFIAGIDSEPISLASLSFCLLLCRFLCGIQVLGVSVAVGAATLVGAAVYWGKMPVPTSLTVIWVEVNSSFGLLIVGGFGGISLIPIDTQRCSVFFQTRHRLLLQKIDFQEAYHFCADLLQSIL